MRWILVTAPVVTPQSLLHCLQEDQHLGGNTLHTGHYNQQVTSTYTSGYKLQAPTHCSTQAVCQDGVFSHARPGTGGGKVWVVVGSSGQLVSSRGNVSTWYYLALDSTGQHYLALDSTRQHQVLRQLALVSCGQVVSVSAHGSNLPRRCLTISLQQPQPQLLHSTDPTVKMSFN